MASDVIELNWSGWATKKAFKTADKNSWKRRWCTFKARTMEFSWHEGDGKPAKGTVKLTAPEMHVDVTTEHGFDHALELRIGDARLFIRLSNAAEMSEVYTRIDAARRAALAADLGGSLLLAADAEGVDAATSEDCRKVFTCGTGLLLGVDREGWQNHSVPQRVPRLKNPVHATSIHAGPEHMGVLTSEKTALLWGSHAFRAVGPSAASSKVWRPEPLVALVSRKVIALACGGCHTLAIVADDADARAGTLMAWGTGKFGQLGLGEFRQTLESPTAVPIPDTPLAGEYTALVSRVYAGMVSSCMVTNLGEVFLWGDGSGGRLGLTDIADRTRTGAVPVLIGQQKVWQPRQLHISAADVGAAEDATLCVVDIALGGAFSLFLVNIDRSAGNVMLVSGALGADPTRDPYGYPVTMEEPELKGILDEEIKSVPRILTPRTVEPFAQKPIVLAAAAGVRHAAVIVADELSGASPRLYTAGRGWLGHAGTMQSRLLPRPSVSLQFAPVGGELRDIDITHVACGHSHTIACTADNSVYAWGRGDSGELGTGSLSDFSMPAKVLEVETHKIVSVAAGSYYSALLAEPSASSFLSMEEVLAGFSSRFAALSYEEASTRATYRGDGDGGGDDTYETGGGGDDEEHVYLPYGWTYDYDESEEKYYFTNPDGETTWDDPRPLPPGWEQAVDEDGGASYFTAPDGETTWDDPRPFPPSVRE